MIPEISALCITPSCTVREAIYCIDRNGKQIALVVDQEGRLIDTITDGDIRRAILAGHDLNESVQALRKRRNDSPYPEPVTAMLGTEPAVLLSLMQEKKVRQLPLLDHEGRVISVVTLRELLQNDSLPLQAVVMAGGYGMRLRPLTEDMPKTMLKVGDRPLLESIISQLRHSGIKRVHLSTNYKKDIIADHFKDGKDFGVEIHYVQEEQPLGTAGSLGLLGLSKEPILVINGDILTQLDFRAMLEFHIDHDADMTIAVSLYEYRIPYGVINSKGIEITAVSEKPVIRHFINAGIYLLKPEACRYVPNGHSCDMPELIAKLISKGGHVISFPIREYWRDIGSIADYEKAQNEYHKIFKE
jgi:dTDP-glucose pyrophosphorylase/CBS domain-containing protein